MSWTRTGATHYHALAQLGLPDKGPTIKALVVTRTFQSYTEISGESRPIRGYTLNANRNHTILIYKILLK